MSLFICTTGIIGDELDHLVRVIRGCGCHYENALSSRTSVLVVKTAQSNKHRTAHQSGIPCVSPLWVTSGHCDRLKTAQFPVLPLLSVKVSSTGLSLGVRQSVVALVEDAGGVFSTSLDRKCRFLVVSNVSSPREQATVGGDKLRFAEKNGIERITVDDLLALVHQYFGRDKSKSRDQAGHPPQLRAPIGSLGHVVCYCTPATLVTPHVRQVLATAGVKRVPIFSKLTTHVVVLGPSIECLDDRDGEVKGVSLGWLETCIKEQTCVPITPEQEAQIPFFPIITLGSFDSSEKEKLQADIERLGGTVQDALIIGNERKFYEQQIQHQQHFSDPSQPRMTTHLVVPPAKAGSSEKVRVFVQTIVKNGRTDECRLVAPSWIVNSAKTGSWLGSRSYEIPPSIYTAAQRKPYYDVMEATTATCCRNNVTNLKQKQQEEDRDFLKRMALGESSVSKLAEGKESRSPSRSTASCEGNSNLHALIANLEAATTTASSVGPITTFVPPEPLSSNRRSGGDSAVVPPTPDFPLNAAPSASLELVMSHNASGGGIQIVGSSNYREARPFSLAEELEASCKLIVPCVPQESQVVRYDQDSWLSQPPLRQLAQQQGQSMPPPAPLAHHSQKQKQQKQSSTVNKRTLFALPPQKASSPHPAASQPGEGPAGRPTRRFLISRTTIADFPNVERQFASMGAVLCENVDECTHYIVKVPQKTESFLCCIAGGKWLLKPSYIEACLMVGQLVDEEPHEWLEDGRDKVSMGPLVAACRKRRLRSSGAFLYWKAVICCDNLNRGRSFMHVLKAGSAASVKTVALPELQDLHSRLSASGARGRKVQSSPILALASGIIPHGTTHVLVDEGISSKQDVCTAVLAAVSEAHKMHPATPMACVYRMQYIVSYMCNEDAPPPSSLAGLQTGGVHIAEQLGSPQPTRKRSREEANDRNYTVID